MPMGKLISSSPWPRSNFGYVFVFDLCLRCGFTWLNVPMEYAVILVPIRLWLIRKPSRRIALSEEAEGKSLLKCEQISDLGITVNSAFIPSANESTLVKDLGVQTDNMFFPSVQCTETANKARRLIFMIRRSIQDHSKSAFIPLYEALVCPHLEYAMPACSPNLVADINHLERIQRFATRLVAGMRHLPYEERLQRLGLHSLQRPRLRDDFITTFTIFKGLFDNDPNFFAVLPLDAA